MSAILGYIIVVVIAVGLFSVVLDFTNNTKIKRKIEMQWGKKSDKKHNDEEISEICGYFNNLRMYEKDKFFIDEITWNDIDMKEIFKDMDTTCSTPGEEVLYAVLRSPIYDEKELENRNEIIEYFRKDFNTRKKIQYILSKLGIKRGTTISNYFYNYNDNENEKSYLNIYRILRCVPVASAVFIFINGYIGLLMIIISFCINTGVHYSFKRNSDYRLRDFTYITKMVGCGNSLLKLEVDKLGKYNDILKEAVSSIKNIKKLYFNLDNNGSDMAFMMEYMNMFFLTDLINYEKMKNTIKRKSDKFKNIYHVIGYIDSCIAISCYRDRIKTYTVPELHRCKHKKGENIIVKDMIHPLLNKAIPNSLRIEDSILITGSNASGKSTFLKTLALNILFSQTICTCTASYFKGYYTRIYTSMALKDNIFNKESYYVVETRSLKRIIDGINDDIPTICFIDEILRGTNTVERIAASSQVLKYLTLGNCICIAATHDIEITYILEKYFKNYHFQENIVDNKILFDYKIHDGKSTTQNAIKLLSIMGYKDDIVNKAQNKADRFLKEGVWAVE